MALALGAEADGVVTLHCVPGNLAGVSNGNGLKRNRRFCHRDGPRDWRQMVFNKTDEKLRQMVRLCLLFRILFREAANGFLQSPNAEKYTFAMRKIIAIMKAA